MYVLRWPRRYIVEDQVHAWGCWSSVMEAVTSYYLGASYNTVGWRPTSASITRDYQAAGHPAANPGAASNLEKAVEITGHLGRYVQADMMAVVGGARRQFRPTTALWDTIVNEILGGRPIVCDMRYNAHPVRHVVLIYGYGLFGNTVYVADPAPGRTRVDTWNLQAFCSNYRAMAHWRSYATTQPNELANLRSLFD